MSRISRFTISAGVFALIVIGLFAPVQAQTQASCQFTTTFNRRLSITGGYRVLVPRGVNDYSTVVGDAQDDTDFSVRAFTRFSGGGISYYRHNSNNTSFTDRNNNGATIGVSDSSTYTYLASANGSPFALQGSVFAPLKMTIGGTSYSKFTIWGINRWGTMVGAFKDSSGKMHGFKLYSDGNAIALDFPGAAETVAGSINDNGTVVGMYSKNLPPNEWRHGFIYNNGKWATLNYPDSTLQTTLSGISNANLIVGTTIKGSNQTGSFLYQNSTFKKIVMPNSSVPTYAYGVSAGKGLITGFSGYTGFIAACK